MTEKGDDAQRERGREGKTEGRGGERERGGENIYLLHIDTELLRRSIPR